MKLGVLASGNLGLSMLEYCRYRNKIIKCVFTDKHSQAIINFCQYNNIACFVGNPRKMPFQDLLRNIEIDILLSINYLFIIPQYLIDLPKRYAINIHGSLLPKYRGRTPHVWSIINNEKEIGITVHLISLDCDAGDIISQVKIPILDDDTGYSLLMKFQNLYPLIIEELFKNIENDLLVFTPQNHKLATFFGRRTPEDGRINWHWQKERIYNWIRAQTNPYPGAFTYYNNVKIVVNRLKYSDLGFNYDQPNGLILSANETNLLIKTTNGVVEISDLIKESNIIIQAGEILI